MYNGLPIVTNKVTIEEQNGIPHHLLGFVSLDEEPWRVGLFKKQASQIIREIRSRGRLPILVGGTHYYTQSLIFEDTLVQEEQDGELDEQQEMTHQEIDEKFPILVGPTEIMIEKLKEVDPVMADRWHPKDRRKIRRSLEIFFLTGKRASEIYDTQQNDKFSKPGSKLLTENDASAAASDLSSTLFFWVYSEPETLKKRLDSRVDKMIESGLLDEVKSMDEFLRQKLQSKTEVDLGRGIWVSIGWKEFEKYLAALENKSGSQKDLDELLLQSIEQVKAATRQYARRQNRWIRTKLVSALLDHNYLEHLYLLDGTDLNEWPHSVSKVALDVAHNFLCGGQLPAPSELSDLAKELLAPSDLNKPAELFVKRECVTCHTTVITEDQWNKHLKSRTHRRLEKKKAFKSTETEILPT